MAKTKKVFPTTFGLFWGWYMEYEKWLTKEDVTEDLLFQYLGKYFHNEKPSGRTLNYFLGFDDNTTRPVFDSLEKLAEFIRCWFDIPIWLEQYPTCGTQFIKFNLGGMKFDIECYDDWGTYNFPIDECGCKIVEQSK